MGPRIEQALRRYQFETGTDLTWKELGERVWARLGRTNLDTSKISRIKNNQQEPSIAESGAFAYELNVSPTWLLWGIGEIGRFPLVETKQLRVAETAPVTPYAGPAETWEEKEAARKKVAGSKKRRSRGAG